MDVSARAIEAVREIARRHGYSIERVIVFGSQVTGSTGPKSDVDLVVVSPDWEGVPFYTRPRTFLIEWPREELPTPDIHPLTPSEFEERSRRPGDIVTTAVEEGVVSDVPAV